MEVVGWQPWLLYLDLDISFISSQKMKIVVHPIPPYGVGDWANITFVCWSGHFNPFLEIVFVNWHPVSYLAGWKLRKHDFSMQLWKLHSILSKKYFFFKKKYESPMGFARALWNHSFIKPFEHHRDFCKYHVKILQVPQNICENPRVL